VRASGEAVPSTSAERSIIVPWAPADLGESGAGSSDATLLSLAAGVRLGGSGRVSPYLDALVGIGYLNDPASRQDYYGYPTSPHGDHTNVALSMGPGVAIRAPSLPGLFADVHYDFYSAKGASTPIIPVRIGLLVP
jgi:hypothetical protein